MLLAGRMSLGLCLHCPKTETDESDLLSDGTTCPSVPYSLITAPVSPIVLPVDMLGCICIRYSAIFEGGVFRGVVIISIAVSKSKLSAARLHKATLSQLQQDVSTTGIEISTKYRLDDEF